MSDGLFEKIEKLIKLNDKLCRKAFAIYSVNDDGSYCFDTTAISFDEDFEQYKRSTFIEINLYRQKEVNEPLLSELIGLRINILNKKYKNISMRNLGTCLNILREFWNDLYIDLKRNEL